ncbi:copper resistance protein CopC (plasmid) [Arthrobacter agilis]|jgi:methionine-rich copper-binding protein CopC|uniref:copper resistance CopC family protein n=1 Tax=Arthrobacter TaxID=1663 RepID=UPI000CE5672A|nr:MULTISPECIES: copper resistance CopC family protein [Arthrobacter]WDF35017.1 copper resistance protein CopC [Arthrobacter agilis]
MTAQARTTPFPFVSALTSRSRFTSEFHSTCQRPRRLFAQIAALIVASALLLLGPVGAATAHDELADSSPAADATVDVAPAEVVLTFTNPPSGIGADIIVSDSTGTIWSEGSTRVVNNTAIQALKSGAPAGTYTAQWRVVSSDDHPIEGTYSFTSTTAQTRSAGSADSPTGQPSTPSTETEEAASAPPAANDPASSTGLPDFVIYLAIGGVILGVVLALITRRLLNKQ